ncbi:MAG TPA: glycosyltransferase family 2 protein [Nitrosopumilaceae archaeon]|nr:glycosyltransferase family 2 protein [Nitrosopumilaceae archaeon]
MSQKGIEFPRIESLSVIIPTYNESQNILDMLRAISNNLPSSVESEIVVVDDNSPDGTAHIAEEYAKNSNKTRLSVKVIHRPSKQGLSSAILAGIESAKGETIIVMDSDFSHPPETIQKMLDELQNPQCDIVVASRYVKGGSVIGWPFKRRLISKSATKIAQHGLGIKIKDPMSGFFAFKRYIIKSIKFDAIGYKMLLELLVKTKGTIVKEIPYSFTNRKLGSSKLDLSVGLDYVRSFWKLYRYGKSVSEKEKRTSLRFFSKAARFYTVGASGLLLNYFISLLFSGVLSNLWYLHATMIGIIFSITSNFILNKIWTFENRNFDLRKTVTQYGLFLGFSGVGAILQLGLVYYLVDSRHLEYGVSLILAVAIASIGNFLLNKKWTFKEKVWS